MAAARVLAVAGGDCEVGGERAASQKVKLAAHVGPHLLRNVDALLQPVLDLHVLERAAQDALGY